MIYYVDSIGGCDCNDGLAPEKAWKSLEKVNTITFLPGDEILFKAGCRFCGQLNPKGDGTSGQPIKISRYGEGDQPCIDGCGSHGTREGNFVDGAAVLFYNQNYWEISDLEITNWNPYYKQGFARVEGPVPNSTMILSPDNRYRYGVLIRWHNYGTGHHIHVKNCYIHDVNSEMQRFCGEGILVVSTGTIGGVQTNFDDILLENNVIADIDRTGISIWSGWAEGRGIDYHNDQETTSNYYHCTVGPWKGSTNVVVRGNDIYRTAGDAILVNTTIGAIVEKNYVEHTCYEMRIGYNAAVWPHNADGTIMQDNEVCYTHGILDGQAFDVDLSCHDTIIRNNYSHDNEGGFLLLMHSAYNNDIYGNISENDRASIFYPDPDGAPGTHIHDNIFYLGMEEMNLFRGPVTREPWKFTNNTFYSRVPGMEINWNPAHTYEGNNYYNIKNIPEDAAARCEKPDFEPSR